MSQDALQYFLYVPGIIWRLFTSFNIPGLGFTPASLMFGILSVGLILYVVNNIFTVGGLVADDVRRHKPVTRSITTTGYDQYGKWTSYREVSSKRLR